MKTHEEMISLIGNMFTDTYVAGARNDLVSFLDAKAQREELFAAVKDLYEEIADRGIRINDLLHELHRYREDITSEAKDWLETNPGKIWLSGIYGDAISHVDDRSLYPASKPEDLKEAFAKYSTIPDDGGKFSEQDLPFPDVEEAAPASEVEGSEDVAGPGPATTEASADAEGEEV